MEKQFKRLLIFGDSFCAESIRFCEKHKKPEHTFGVKNYFKEQYNNSPSWIDTLCDRLDVSVDHVGDPGTGPGDVVWQLTNFLADNALDSNDIVIICWSQYNRSKDKKYNPVRFPAEYSEREERLANAARMYFNFIYNDDERLNVYNASVLAVDKLLENFSGKLLHFFCFDTEFYQFQSKSAESRIKQTYQPTTGNLCTQFCLSELCEKHHRTGPDDNRFWSRYPNHMGPRANEDLISYIQEHL